jgi:predicted glycoside hydrolase/deacetylase ChbG (UPF0249 family)
MQSRFLNSQQPQLPKLPELPKLNDPRVSRWTRRLTGLLLSLVLPLYAYKVYLKTDYTDFDVYYRSAARALHGQWNEVYTLADGASPFRYAPLFLPFFQPFAQLPPTQARVVWFILQYFWFGFGFYWIYKSLILFQNPRNSKRALTLTALTALFVLRFCLDTFMIGQVSSLMFLGFSWGSYSWIRNHSSRTSLGISIPTLFKIGPGFLYGVFLNASNRSRLRAFLTFLGVAFGLQLITLAWTGSWKIYQNLWKSWMLIVASDSSYYDASHYGSQSLKSVLLRSVNSGWMTSSQAELIYLISAVGICGTIALFWFFRQPRKFYGRALFFSLGLFAYVWVMPETFKYSLTPLAIPLALLLHSPRKSILCWTALILSAGTLSLAGKDLVGDFLFFENQRYSLPFFSTLFIFAAVFELSWIHSAPSRRLKTILRCLDAEKKNLGPWTSLPHLERRFEATLLLPIPFEKSSVLAPELIQNFIQDAQNTLGNSVEILVIPYGPFYTPLHPVNQAIHKLQIRILPHSSEIAGRGAALRCGFLASYGKKLLIANAEQLCESSFFSKALTLLDQNYDLVRANRRLEQSRFQIAVRYLSLVWGRHRLGLVFNSLIRAVLPIQTTDTHSGTLALSWRLAQDAFAVQTSSGFLFDLELSLTARGHEYPETDLPVTLRLAGEKDFLRVLVETCSIGLGLPSLAWRYYQGCYRSTPKAQGITADDWGLSPGVNQGILRLAKLGVVRRVSLMANCPYLEDGLLELSQIPGIKLGLHFTLTYGRPSSENSSVSPHLTRQGQLIPSPAQFMMKWLSPFTNRKLNREHVRAELTCQLKRIQSLGISLQYVDGHHHIHLVPGLIDSVADLIQKSGIQKVRLPYDPKLWKTSQAPLILLSILARRKFIHHGFESLPCIYPQKGYYLDQGKLRARLAKHPQSEVIVHPAETNDLATLEFPDSYTNERVLEYRALRMLSLIS